MAELTIETTYGSALLQAARDRGKTEIIREEASQVLEIFNGNSDLSAVINYPGISAEEKKEILKNIFEGRICAELLNLLYILVDKGRAHYFPQIVKAYKEMINREEGYAYGTIFSVKPLKKEQLEKFEEETAKLLRCKVRLENELDPKILGGVKILVEGKMIDASIRKRFRDLENNLI